MAAERPKARRARPTADSAGVKLYRTYSIEDQDEDKLRSDLHTASHVMGSHGVLARLRLGSLNATRPAHLSEHGVTHVVNCLSKAAEVHDADLPLPLEYMTLDLEDEEEQLLEFDPVLDFIHTALHSNKKAVVLVHCAMGVSRSASFVCAYMMREERLSLTDALTRMRAVRCQVAPNPGFLQQLIEYEGRLKPPAVSPGRNCRIM